MVSISNWNHHNWVVSVKNKNVKLNKTKNRISVLLSSGKYTYIPVYMYVYIHIYIRTHTHVYTYSLHFKYEHIKFSARFSVLGIKKNRTKCYQLTSVILFKNLSTNDLPTVLTNIYLFSFNLTKLHYSRLIFWVIYIETKSLCQLFSTCGYLPPCISFVIILFLVIRSKERDRCQILILRTYTSQYAEAMYFAINSRASALLDCNLNIPVILRR